MRYIFIYIPEREIRAVKIALGCVGSILKRLDSPAWQDEI